jgi:hypothetical protein
VIGASLLLTPLLARADQLVRPEAEAAAPSAYRNNARPFGMADLEASSSLGLGATAGWSSDDLFYGETELIGELAVDGELALGRHLKLFASAPRSFFRNDQESQGGGGNLTLGSMVLGGTSQVTAALGATYSFGGSDAGHNGLYLRYDQLGYVNEDRVLHAFGDLRATFGKRFLQLQLDMTRWKQTSTESGWGWHEFGTLTMGGGAQLPSGTWLLADLGLVRYFSDHHYGQSDETFVVANAGLRWRVAPDSRASWGVRTSLLHVHDLTTLGVGFELRADFLALGVSR